MFGFLAGVSSTSTVRRFLLSSVLISSLLLSFVLLASLLPASLLFLSVSLRLDPILELIPPTPASTPALLTLPTLLTAALLRDDADEWCILDFTPLLVCLVVLLEVDTL